jgi:hypothetical protein
VKRGLPGALKGASIAFVEVAAMVNYREFLYLDEKLVTELLAQVEDGIYDEDEHTTATGTDQRGGIDGRVGTKEVHLAGKRDHSETGSEQHRRVTRQTPESRFNRLHEALSGDLARVAHDVPDLWRKIEARELVEVDGYVDIPTFGRALASADELGGLMQMMQMLAPDQVTPEAERAITGVRAMQSVMRGSLVATVELEEGDPTFITKLDEQWLRVSTGDLEGEASVLGRVKRRWPEGQSYPLLAVPGLDVMSRKDRRAAERRGGQAEQSSELMLEGPAATLSVVAIYR